MNIHCVSPEIREEILRVLKEWGIDTPDEMDFTEAATEVFHVRGVAPVTLVDNLLYLISVPSQPSDPPNSEANES